MASAGMRSELVHARIELLRGYSIEITSGDERSATVAIETLLSGDLCSILAKGRQSCRLRVIFDNLGPDRGSSAQPQ
jgi:hypothetical protein